MNKTLKMTAVTIIAVLGVLIIYRILFIKAVSRNTVKGNNPAANLNGAGIGMDQNDITAAHFRWALFEEWARSRPQYKGWESDPEIFKKANEEFKDKVKADVKVLK